MLDEEKRAEFAKNDYTDYFKNRDWVHQIGFYSPDWKAFAEAHHELFGSGPFYYTTNRFGRVLYRGTEVKNFALHACYGAWGSHSVEVVSVDSDYTGPSFYSDINDLAKPGINHLHMFVEDLDEAKYACEQLGIDIVCEGYSSLENTREKMKSIGMPFDEATFKPEMGFMVIDLTKDLGMMVQLINPPAKRLHDFILASAKGWDGESDLFRDMAQIKRG